MKKILFLLLSTVAMYGQVPADATPLENIQITNNKTSTTATKVNVQENDGTINTISKSDLVNVVEVNDVPTLPLVGEVGKIYVVKNVNKIYRWNGTFYQELAGSDISGLQAQIDSKANDSDVVKLSGNQTISGQKTFNNSSTGSGIVSTNSSTGFGIVSTNSSTGSGIVSTNSSTGDGIVSRQTGTATGFNYVGQNNSTNTFTVDKTGNVIGNSYIKRSTPANNILLAGGGDLDQASLPVSTATQTALNLKANLASPSLTGTPTAPTATAGTNTTQIATTAFVLANASVTPNATTSVKGIVKLAGDLGGTADLPTVPALASKANLASPTFTGTPTAPTATVGTNTTQIATTAFVGGGLATKENSFTKNTAFNKNFGTTAGTVVEGNYPPAKDGTGATGTWGINISGNAANSTLWNGYDMSVAPSDVAPSGILGYYNSGVTFQRSSATALSSFLGLGSNAYTSTAFAPITGGTGYIQNQNASAQSANMWISGTYMSAYNANGYNIELNKTGGFGSALALRSTSGSSGSLLRMFKPNNTDFYDLYTSSTGIELNGTVTASPATLDTQLATLGQVRDSRPYKVYTALLTQSGTNAPVATVLENTLGGTVVWTRESTGKYIGTLSGAFVAGKTFFMSSAGTSIYLTRGVRVDNNNVSISAFQYAATASDGGMTDCSIEIRVYL